jgi:hypothetical protein
MTPLHASTACIFKLSSMPWGTLENIHFIRNDI